MTDPYRTEAEIVARQCWSRWNRDPASPSFGSFDRAYWGWKQRDFADATLQAGVTLALAWSDRTFPDADLEPLLAGFARHCALLQHRDGSFDQVYPNERTPGVGLDIMSALVAASTRTTSIATKAQLDSILERAVLFALKTDEVHGLVANHLVSFAWELCVAGDHLGDPRAQARADHWLDRALASFDGEEGWFNEYEGPDPGYQTRTLAYLTKIAERPGKQDLWPVCERAARFVEIAMMPDGSLHPALGVRSTALLYPSGFMRLAARNEAFAPLAASVRQAWAAGAAPLPSWLDFDNALRLGHDAWDAAEVADASPSVVAVAQRTAAAATSGADLPRAGLRVLRTPTFALYAHTRLGAFVVWSRDTGGEWRLRHEDCGYLVEAAALSTRAPHAARAVASDAWLTWEGAFLPVLHEELTPPKLLLLRLLNLTVLRAQWLGDLFRKLLVARLIARKATGSGRVRRTIRLQANRITVEDEIEMPPGHGDTALLLCRRMTSAHMASSRYFQPAELPSAAVPWTVLVASRGLTRRHAFAIEHETSPGAEAPTMGKE